MSTSNELKSTKEEVIEQTITIPDFNLLLQRPVSESGPSYNPQQLMTPHVFSIITSPENVTNESPWHAEAVLSLDPSSKLVLTISVPDKKQIPSSWNVEVNFNTIHFVNTRGSTLADVYNQNRQRNPSMFSNTAEANLSTSDCIAVLNITANAARHFVDSVEETLKIRFSLQAKIAKPASSLETPVPNIAKAEFEQCGIQALTDFESLLKDTVTADIEIKVTLGTQKSFNCHKSILAARSPILRAMFESPLKEAQDKVLIVEDLSADTIEHFLSFLYCGRFQNESWVKFLPHLTYAADKYCVSSLKDLCDSNLIRSVTCHNALAIANLAQRHQLTKAVADIRTFIAKNVANLNFDISAATQELEIVE